MSVVERSAVIPLSLAETWEAFNGNEMQNLVEMSDSVVEVTDYRMRDDGTPEYVMVNKAGQRLVSHRSDYTLYEPPHRSVDRVLDSPLGGVFYTEHEQVEGGTKVTNRWEVEPHGFMKLMWPLMRNSMAKNFQADLDAIAERLAAKSQPSG